MRLLFEIDTKDYDITGKAFVRPSVRSIIIKDKKIAMVYSVKYDYYKFPGGGIESGESKEDALIRETAEEAGLVIEPSTIKEYGYVHRIQKNYHDDADYFVQDNYYYFCSCKEDVTEQRLDDYEMDEKFTLKFVYPEEAISANMKSEHGPKDRNMIEREAKVLELLINEGYFCKYGALWRYLKVNNREEYKLSYEEIRNILGFGIDHSFLTYKKELKEYGYEVGKISMKEKMVMFNKI